MSATPGDETGLALESWPGFVTPGTFKLARVLEPADGSVILPHPVQRVKSVRKKPNRGADPDPVLESTGVPAANDAPDGVSFATETGSARACRE